MIERPIYSWPPYAVAPSVSPEATAARGLLTQESNFKDKLIERHLREAHEPP